MLGSMFVSMFGSMKLKTSITISDDLLAAVDRLAGSSGSRSALIERVLRRYIEQHTLMLENRQELEKINRGAERLNAEAADVLEYQAMCIDE